MITANSQKRNYLKDGKVYLNPDGAYEIIWTAGKNLIFQRGSGGLIRFFEVFRKGKKTVVTLENYRNSFWCCSIIYLTTGLPDRARKLIKYEKVKPASGLLNVLPQAFRRVFGFVISIQRIENCRLNSAGKFGMTSYDLYCKYYYCE